MMAEPSTLPAFPYGDVEAFWHVVSWADVHARHGAAARPLPPLP